MASNTSLLDGASSTAAAVGTAAARTDGLDEADEETKAAKIDEAIKAILNYSSDAPMTMAEIAAYIEEARDAKKCTSKRPEMIEDEDGPMPEDGTAELDTANGGKAVAPKVSGVVSTGWDHAENDEQQSYDAVEDKGQGNVAEGQLERCGPWLVIKDGTNSLIGKTTLVQVQSIRKRFHYTNTMRTLAFLLIPAAAIGSSPNTTPRQNGNVNIVEYCGQCIWSGNIVCEARAQFLVREYGDLTLEEARASILDKCTDDGSDKVVISLDAYCGECPWQARDFNCDQRVAYLTSTYLLSEEQAQAATVETGECIDPNYIPESLRTDEEAEPKEESGGLSTGAIVGIIVAILALLLCLLAFWMLSRKRNEKDEKKSDETAEALAVPLGGADTTRAKDGEEVPPEAAPAPVKNRRDRPSKGVSFGLSRPDPDGDTGFVAADDYVAPPKEEKSKDTDKGTEQVAEAAASSSAMSKAPPPLPPRILAIQLPPGPLGASLAQTADNGTCVVSSVTSDANSQLLRVGDVIVSLNGIKMGEVEGGAASWTHLFEAFGSGERNLIVHRSGAAGFAKEIGDEMGPNVGQDEGDEEEHSHFLDLPDVSAPSTAAGLENASSDHEGAAMPAARTNALDETDEEAKAAEIDEAIKAILNDSSDAPMTPADIAAYFEDAGDAKKCAEGRPETIDDEDSPMPEGDTAEIDAANGGKAVAPKVSGVVSTGRDHAENDEQSPFDPANTGTSLQPPEQLENSTNQQAPAGVPVLEARLVEEETVVDAVPVSIRRSEHDNNIEQPTPSWWRQHQRLIILVMFLFIAALIAILGAFLLSSGDGDSNGSETSAVP